MNRFLSGALQPWLETWPRPLVPARLLLVTALALALAASAARPQAPASCFAPGDYYAQPVASYDCCFGNVTFSVSRWRFFDLGGGAIAVDGMSGTLPVLQGTINCADGSFMASQTLSGSCTERYTLVGQFSSPGQWTGTFSATYTGSACSCLGFDPCTNRQWSVSGISTALSVGPGVTPGIRLTAGPNPFRRSIGIDLELDRAAAVAADILDLEGRVVETLCDRLLGAGAHRFEWTRNTRAGARAPSGLYLLRVRVGGKGSVTKLVAME